MKKSLLKASLICLGVTLLCGMSSYRIPEGVKSQGRNASIINDTIIISAGEESQCIKEIVDEGNKSGCTCNLYVSTNPITGYWTLYLQQYCNTLVHVEYSYIIKYADHSQKQFRCKKDLVRNGSTSVREKSIIANPEEIECIPVSVKAWACFEKE